LEKGGGEGRNLVRWCSGGENTSSIFSNERKLKKGEQGMRNDKRKLSSPKWKGRKHIHLPLRVSSPLVEEKGQKQALRKDPHAIFGLL